MADKTALELLASIDASLKALLAAAPRGAPAGVSSAPAAVASDTDLDGKFGNPILKMKDPRDWTGEPMTGRLMSECPAEYLDMVADRADYFAGKNDAEGALANNGKPKSTYDRLDAARARGWALRKRNGWTDPALSDGAVSAPLFDPSGQWGASTPTPTDDGAADEIPF